MAANPSSPLKNFQYIGFLSNREIGEGKKLHKKGGLNKTKIAKQIIFHAGASQSLSHIFNLKLQDRASVCVVKLYSRYPKLLILAGTI